MNELVLPPRELALFAGAGGGILGGKLLGWRTVCAVELDAYCRRVLLARQRDGFLPRFPIWDSVETFDGYPWRGNVDVVSGGFPCTDISAAKQNAEGIAGKSSGLWREMARIVGEIRPQYVFVENSPMLVKRGLAVVLSDLAEMGYASRWAVLGAHHAGAPHKRERIWIVGYSEREGLEGYAWHENKKKRREDESGSDPPSGISVLEGVYSGGPWGGSVLAKGEDGTSRRIQPGIRGVAYGVANRVDRLKAIGNGQVPSVAALAWRTLTEKLNREPLS